MHLAMREEGYFSTAEKKSLTKIVHPKSHSEKDSDLSELSNLR